MGEVFFVVFWIDNKTETFRSIEEDKVPFDPTRKGTVNFFDTSKGFGFIIDSENNEKYFTHVSGLIDTIAENDKVIFELEKGTRGMNAVRVKLDNA